MLDRELAVLNGHLRHFFIVPEDVPAVIGVDCPVVLDLCTEAGSSSPVGEFVDKKLIAAVQVSLVAPGYVLDSGYALLGMNDIDVELAASFPLVPVIDLPSGNMFLLFL